MNTPYYKLTPISEAPHGTPLMLATLGTSAYAELNKITHYLAPFDLEQYAWEWIQKLNEKDIEIIELKKRLASCSSPGGVWVKPSENRWPIEGSEVLFKYRGLKHFGFYSSMNESEMFSTGSGLCVHRSEIDEYLDESGTPATLAEPVEGMRWVKASDQVPSIFDSHERHYRVDGKKVDGGRFYKSPNGDFVFEYRHLSGFITDADLSSVEWLDESSTPSAREAELEREVESMVAQLHAVYEGADQWKQEYNDARSLLQQLWELKFVKNREGKTEAYQQRQPKVWEKVELFLSSYQHQ